MQNTETKISQMVEENPTIWKTVPSFYTWLRGGIRKSMWNTHPVKIEYKKKYRKQIKNPNPKGKKPTVWGGVCDICQGHFIEKELQVDHKHGGSFSLKNMEDLPLFLENLIIVVEDDLRLVCKDCNYTLSYAKRNNLTYESALIHRYAKKLENDKTLKQFFIDRSLPYPGSIPKAKNKVIQILESELESNKINE